MRGGFSYDVSPANNAPIPACASATLPYENRIIKPGPQALSTTRRGGSRPRRLIASSLPITTRLWILRVILKRACDRAAVAAISVRVRQRRLFVAPADTVFSRRCGNVTQLTLNPGWPTAFPYLRSHTFGGIPRLMPISCIRGQASEFDLSG